MEGLSSETKISLLPLTFLFKVSSSLSDNLLASAFIETLFLRDEKTINITS